MKTEPEHVISPTWTDEKIAQFRELWALNELSAQKIAEQIGGVSKNAVVGKARRLHLESRAQPVTSTPEQRAARRARKLRRKHGAGGEVHQVKAAIERRETVESNIAPDVPLEPAPVYTDSRNLTLLELEPRDCRFPTTPHDAREHRFCGRRKLELLPYCLEHLRKSYQVRPAR